MMIGSFLMLGSLQSNK